MAKIVAVCTSDKKGEKEKDIREGVFKTGFWIGRGCSFMPREPSPVEPAFDLQHR
jgi:hypothetical protein